MTKPLSNFLSFLSQTMFVKRFFSNKNVHFPLKPEGIWQIFHKNSTIKNPTAFELRQLDFLFCANQFHKKYLFKYMPQLFCYSILSP